MSEKSNLAYGLTQYFDYKPIGDAEDVSEKILRTQLVGWERPLRLSDNEYTFLPPAIGDWRTELVFQL